MFSFIVKDSAGNTEAVTSDASGNLTTQVTYPNGTAHLTAPPAENQILRLFGCAISYGLWKTDAKLAGAAGEE